MSTLLYRDNCQDQWLNLVQTAEEQAQLQLPLLLEHYLTSLLLRFTKEPSIVSTLLTESYVQAHQLEGSAKHQAILDVAEKCLLLTGLFPARAQRRMSSVRYWTELGQMAYRQLAIHDMQTLAQFYDTIAKEFIALMTVLVACRQTPFLEPAISQIDAYELWQITPCEALFRQLGYNLPSEIVAPSNQTRH